MSKKLKAQCFSVSGSAEIYFRIEGCRGESLIFNETGSGLVIIREIENMVDDPLTVNIGAPGTLVLD